MSFISLKTPKGDALINLANVDYIFPNIGETRAFVSFASGARLELTQPWPDIIVSLDRFNHNIPFDLR